VDAVQVAANPTQIYVADKDAGLFVLEPKVQVGLNLVTGTNRSAARRWTWR
jgi:hypothetical protein